MDPPLRLTIRSGGGRGLVLETVVPVPPSFAERSGVRVLQRGTVQFVATGANTSAAVVVLRLRNADADAGRPLPDAALDGAVVATGGVAAAAPFTGSPAAPALNVAFVSVAWTGGGPPAGLPDRAPVAVTEASLLPIGNGASARLRLRVGAPPSPGEERRKGGKEDRSEGGGCGGPAPPAAAS